MLPLTVYITDRAYQCLYLPLTQLADNLKEVTSDGSSLEELDIDLTYY